MIFSLQAALGSWVPLCEAVASWRMIQDEGLRNEINVIMQAFRANLVRNPLCLWPDCNHCSTVLQATRALGTRKGLPSP